MSRLRHPFILSLLLCTGVFVLFSAFTPETDAYHARGTHLIYRLADLSTFEGEWFTGSGNCVACHGPDENGEVNVNANGEDVSVVTHWQATMMANSARDPFWKAKVSHEVLNAPQYQTEIENTCATCHAPQGHYEAILTGAEHFTMADLAESELGQDGVGCIGCHRIEDDGLGDRFNGDLPFAEENIAYGPFNNPWDGLMSGLTGFIPVHGEHTTKSELCASCHSLFTSTLDLDGEPVGSTFFEQATYHEWLNSDYPGEDTECQTCHTPRVEGGVIVSDQPNWLFPQTFGQHHFVGGNTFMLRLMQDHKEELGISASDEQYDATIQRTLDQLQQQTVNMNVQHVRNENDTAYFVLELENLAGHKFPSGYPARISMLEFLLREEGGNTIFQSGGYDENMLIPARDELYEPHWDVINSEDQVQIYEMVMADVTDAPTTILERAYYPLKDNRLVPRGFRSDVPVYDTTLMAGTVLTDANFNEGRNGSDLIEYRVPLNGYEGELVVEATLWYQSVPPRWVDEMFAESTPEIESFKAMFESTAQEPVEVRSIELVSNTQLQPTSPDPLVFPNPTTTGYVSVALPEDTEIDQVQVFDQSGRLMQEGTWNKETQLVWLGSDAAGRYYIVMETTGGRVVVSVVKL